MSMTVSQARELMQSWVENPSLRGHMECVARCMRVQGEALDPDHADDWEIAGLLHDMDYEKHPTIEEHPFVAVQALRDRGDVPDSVIQSILGHADYSGVPRETLMAKHLFACDELAGFIVACARVRPDGISELQVKSILKKLKNAKFAAAVSRDDVRNGAAEIGRELDEHIGVCLEALRSDRERLGI